MTDSAPASTNASRSLQSSERRAWVRYPPRRLEMLWHLFGMKPPELRTAHILDVSTQGVGLIVEHSFAQGSVLVLKFADSPLGARPLLVRVKHVQAIEDNQFKVGCTFVVPLSEEQLTELIR